jgi:hypothetical protein
MYMEVPQGNFLCRYLKQAKLSFLSSFFLIQNWRTEGKNKSFLGSWYQWEGEGGGERVKEGEYGVSNNFCKCHNVPLPSTTK